VFHRTVARGAVSHKAGLIPRRHGRGPGQNLERTHSDRSTESEFRHDAVTLADAVSCWFTITALIVPVKRRVTVTHSRRRAFGRRRELESCTHVETKAERRGYRIPR